MVNASTNRGEKVLSAYIMLSPFVLIVVVVGGFGSARLFSFCSSVVNRNEWVSLPRRVMPALYAHKTNMSSFFLTFFFARVWARGCGRVGVGAWVWGRGCGGVGVGAWVGRWGRRDGDGRARDEAGWIGMVAVGWARIASLCLPNPNSDCRLGDDR